MINSVAILLISYAEQWAVQDEAYFVCYSGFKTREHKKIRDTIFRETCITVRLVRNLSVCAIIISIRGVIMFQKGVAILNVYNQLKLDCEQKTAWSLFSWWCILISPDKNVKTRIS